MGQQVTGQNPQGGGFSRPIQAEQADHLTLRDSGGERADRAAITVVLVKFLDLDHVITEDAAGGPSGRTVDPPLPHSAAAWDPGAAQVIPQVAKVPTEFESQPLSEAHGEDGARLHRPISSFETASFSAAELASRVRAAGQELGFVRVGFAAIDPLELDAERLSAWLAAGRHAEMDYLVDGPRHDPRQLLSEAKTLIAVALAYPASVGLVALRRAEDGPPLTGIVARYARGEDYHDVMRKKLRRLADAVANLLGRPVLARHCVDTAPLLERAAAERAGLGFAAKSTNDDHSRSGQLRDCWASC